MITRCDGSSEYLLRVLESGNYTCRNFAGTGSEDTPGLKSPISELTVSAPAKTKSKEHRVTRSLLWLDRTIAIARSSHITTSARKRKNPHGPRVVSKNK
ncbi:hypothetical protein WA026_020604 [Henosepilachna vigintioctopunctata]|uniref:Uncharacterized protein n=1 Tax=Henosepilachna vigintioctopunctata TaxID=420089 RepID=A0AAW1UUI4_9CUCU